MASFTQRGRLRRARFRSRGPQSLEPRRLLAADSFSVVSVADFSGDGQEDLVVVGQMPGGGGSIRSIETDQGQTVSEVAFSTTQRFVKAIDFTEGGQSRLAVLFQSQTNGRSSVQIRDPATGSRLDTIAAFTSGYRALDIVNLPAADGSARLVVLAHQDSTDVSRIKTIDPSTGRSLGVSRITPGNRMEFDAVSIHPLQSNSGADAGYVTVRVEDRLGSPEVVPFTETTRLDYRHQDFRNGQLFSSTVDLTGLNNDPSTNPPIAAEALPAVIRTSGSVTAILEGYAGEGLGRSLHLFQDGSTRRTVELPRGTVPIDFDVLSDGNRAHFSVLVVKQDTGASFVYRFFVTDDDVATTSANFNLSLSKDFVHQGNAGKPLDLTLIAREAGSERIAIRYRSDDGSQRIRIATIHGQHLRTIPLEETPLERGEIPDWYDENRVQFHTRLGPVHPNPDKDGFWRTDEIDQAGEGIAGLGGKVLTRHFDAGNEDPWYPSYSPPGPLDADGDPSSNFAGLRTNQGIRVPARVNLAQRWVDEAAANDVSLIAYNWISSDKSITEENPQWVCRAADGSPISHFRRGTYLDLASDYGDIVRDRLIEQAAMGVNGFYFDSIHLPTEGCFGGAFEAGFIADTGLAAPTTTDTTNRQAWEDYRAKFLSEYFVTLANQVHEQFPDVLFVISDTSTSGLIDDQMSTRQSAPGVAKSEYRFAIRFDADIFADNPSWYVPAEDVRMALGWTMLRAAGEDRPPHIWMSGFETKDHVETFVSSLLAYGAIANTDIAEANILTAQDLPLQTTREVSKHGIEIGNRLSPALSGTTPDVDVAIVFSEQQRDIFDSPSERYVNVVAPLTATMQAAIDSGIRTQILLDQDFLSDNASNLPTTIAVVHRDSLSPIIQNRLSDLELAGHVIVDVDVISDWITQAGFENGVAAIEVLLVDNLDQRLGMTETDSRVHVRTHSSNTSSSITVIAVNDFSYVRSIREIAAGRTGPPQPATIRQFRMTVPLPSGTSLVDAEQFTAVDLVTGERVEMTVSAAGWEIAVPDFDQFAAIEIRHDPPTDLNFGASDSVERISQIAAIETVQVQLRAEPETIDAALEDFDVNGDGELTPLDALILINRIRRQSTASDPQSLSENGVGELDEVVRPEFVRPIDALRIINELRRQQISRD